MTERQHDQGLPRYSLDLVIAKVSASVAFGLGGGSERRTEECSEGARKKAVPRSARPPNAFSAVGKLHDMQNRRGHSARCGLFVQPHWSFLVRCEGLEVSVH